MQGAPVTRRALIIGAALSSLGFDARAGTPERAPLFVIARSKNANVIHYAACLEPNGALDPNRPLVAYWIMRAEDGRREGLTWLEERFAYGWSASFDARGDLSVRLRAFPARELRVGRAANGAIRATLRIAGAPAVLDRIYVASDGGGLAPTVRYVDLFGKALADGRRVKERIVPGSHA